jgi:hypothetical protein
MKGMSDRAMGASFAYIAVAIYTLLGHSPTPMLLICAALALAVIGIVAERTCGRRRRRDRS